MQNALFDVFIHKYVSPVCKETHKVSENKTPSLFLRTQISKKGGTTGLIQISCRYDVMSERGSLLYSDGYSPCGKAAREKAFELHTVSEIILDVVLNIMAFNHGSI